MRASDTTVLGRDNTIASGIYRRDTRRIAGRKISHDFVDYRHELIKGRVCSLVVVVHVRRAVIVATDCYNSIDLRKIVRKSIERHRTASTFANDYDLICIDMFDTLDDAIVFGLIGFVFITPVHRYKSNLGVATLPSPQGKSPEAIKMITESWDIHDVSHELCVSILSV